MERSASETAGGFQPPISGDGTQGAQEGGLQNSDVLDSIHISIGFVLLPVTVSKQ